MPVRRGVRVLQDVFVVGLDDTSIAALPYVDLTTVRRDSRALAAQALDAVIHRM